MAYITLVHICLVVLLFKTNLFENVLLKLEMKRMTPEETDFYRKSLDFQLRVDESVPDGSILFFGDSIIHGLCVTAVSHKGINFGISKDTARCLSKRIKKYTSIKSASAIVIAVGINDLKSHANIELETVHEFENILSYFDKVQPIVLSAILPLDETMGFTGLNRRIDSTNNKLKNLCKLRCNCFFIDMSPEMIDERGNLHALNHRGDGIHLNKRGYQILIKGLERTLRNCGLQKLQ